MHDVQAPIGTYWKKSLYLYRKVKEKPGREQHDSNKVAGSVVNGLPKACLRRTHLDIVWENGISLVSYYAFQT